MMGHKEPARTGDELDLVTKWRQLLKFMGRAGVCRKLKTGMSRRARREARRDIAREGIDER